MSWSFSSALRALCMYATAGGWYHSYLLPLYEGRRRIVPQVKADAVQSLGDFTGKFAVLMGMGSVHINQLSKSGAFHRLT